MNAPNTGIKQVRSFLFDGKKSPPVSDNPQAAGKFGNMPGKKRKPCRPENIGTSEQMNGKEACKTSYDDEWALTRNHDAFRA